MNNLEFEWVENEVQKRVLAETMAQKHAKDVIIFAYLGGMPDTFWLTDSRIEAACVTLNWEPQQAKAWAETGVY